MNPELADAVISLVQSYISSNPTAVRSEWQYATWVAAESVDSNLSRIAFPDGTEVRGVPKGAHVTGLSAGNVILCAVPRQGTMMIIAKQSGNPTLYVA